MKENILKNLILVFMLISKIAVLAWILFHFSTHGLTKSETFSVISIVLPVFAVYLTVIVKDVLSEPFVEERRRKARKIKSPVLIIAAIVFPLYVVLILGSITQTAKGNFSGDDLQMAIGVIESAFGVYIGQLIMTLFKSKNS